MVNLSWLTKRTWREGGFLLNFFCLIFFDGQTTAKKKY